MTSKSFTHFFLVVSAIFSSIILPAQPVNKPYFHFKTFTINDGLISNNGTHVFKDSRGFLWIGTDRGLQRFNGSTFLSFRHLNSDTNSILNENITSITEDSKHNIWIATIGGVAKFNYQNGKFINYNYVIKEGRKEQTGDVFFVFEDSRGRLWAGARPGLYLLDTIKNQFVNVSPVNIQGMDANSYVRVSSMVETAAQEIIFSVVDGFVILSKDGKQQYLHMPEPAIRPINHIPANLVMVLKDYPDEIWVTANLNGLFKYERSKDKWTNYRSGGVLSADLIRKACIEWNKDEWLLGSDNLCLFNHRTGVFKKAFDDKKINSISSVYREDNGNLWFTSNAEGLILLDLYAQLFSSVQFIPGAGADKLLYYSKAMDALYGMNIYFASGIVKLDLLNNKVTYDSIRGFTPFVTVMNNFIADNDTLYIAMEKGFWLYDLKKHKLDSIVFKEGNSSSQQAFFFNLCKSGNKIYFTGKFGDGGPFVYDKITRTVKNLGLVYTNPGQPNTSGYYPSNVNSTVAHGQVNTKDLPLLYKKNNDPGVYGFCLALNRGILYTGMNFSDSIYTYNEITGAKKNIAIPPDYINGKPCNILSLCIDKRQNLWCGTAGNGILVFNIPAQKWVRSISQRDGYFPVLTKGIVADEDGVVWCGTSEGLFSFNPDNFRFKNFTLNEGLHSENDGGNLLLLPGHRLLSNNINYPFYEYTFAVINTKPADTAVQTIDISITNLKLVGENYLTDTLLDNMQEIILPPDKNAFSLNYAGISLTNGSKLLYSYMLEGAEKKWHEVGKEQSLSYINLSPGKYTLRIKCRSLDETIMGKERVLYIHVLPAWYQTMWFKIAIILCIALLIFATIRYYLRQQLKKQQAIIEKEHSLREERSRIAADMHDDVGAGLSRIRYITASLKEGKELSTEDMDKILSLSDDSVEKMNEIIWSLNQGNQQLDELIYHIRSQCAEMVNNADLAFNFELPENIPQKTMDWKESRNIYLLVKEAVNNAIKHAGAKTITIECSIEDQQVFSIADDGIGFDTALASKNGNGLINYKKRIEKLNGTYQLITGPGKGTTVVFTIPFHNVV